MAAENPAARQAWTDEIAASERRSLESHTLSRLAALERSLNDFVQREGRVPASLDELVPKYLAGIPEVELGSRRHNESNQVTYYPAEAIVDGQVNGALLKDTGGWGFVSNGRQVILFVDCVHKMMDGSFWYQARGVY
jgi:hypothetical protein